MTISELAQQIFLQPTEAVVIVILLAALYNIAIILLIGFCIQTQRKYRQLARQHIGLWSRMQKLQIRDEMNTVIEREERMQRQQEKDNPSDNSIDNPLDNHKIKFSNDEKK